MKALILVDLQYDFMPGGALGVEKGDEIVEIINQILPKFPLVVASQDWHPENHVSFAKTHHKNVGDSVIVNGRKQILWPIHCVAESYGASLVQTLKLDQIQKCIHKGTDLYVDSYSVFFDNDKKKETGLHLYLKKRGIDELFFAGLATDYCVKYSVLDAVDLGYQTRVFLDACRPVNLHPDDEKKAVLEMEKKGAQMVFSPAYLYS